MEGQDHGSVSVWIEQLKAGENDAARHLWERYFEKLLTLARQRLGHAPRRAFDEEDIAVSVFDSLCQGAHMGRFTEMRDRTDLWKLLLTITRQKAVDRIRHETAQKRGAGKTRGESVFDGDGKTDARGLNEILGESPTPELLLMLEEENQRLLNGLRDDTLRRVAVHRLCGYTNAEIAERLQVTTRTVERKLDLIRQSWREELEA